jgi:flagellar basal body P-ring formation protein FlgA
MELPSFYRTFAKNILRHSVSYLSNAQKLHKSSKFCAFAVTLITASNSFYVEASGLYSHLQLKQDVTRFLAEEYAQIPHERIDINVGNLDGRLRLGQCPVPVTFSAQDQTGLGGNISVKAQCSSQIAWTVHVPAQVMIYREIPVAAQDISRGQSLTDRHFSSALMNISNIRQGFADTPQAIIGREAKRNIGKGEVFKTAQLDSPTTIRRGELVTLESIAGSIKVSSSGTAMSDGRLGQKIRVKNGSSERVISGIVKGQGLVQTL